jgi:uncharacterized protein YoxC
MFFLQVAAVADTMIVRQVPPVRTAFEQLVFVASGLTSILTLLAVLVVLMLLVGMRQAAQALQAKLDEVLGELRPLTHNATAASQDLREATAMAKAMVAESRETVSMANQRVRAAVDDLGDRVAELSEIIAAVSRMATRIASLTATAIGGLKAGARVLGLGKKRKANAASVLREHDEKPRLRRRR